jgi:hypothetical protein
VPRYPQYIKFFSPNFILNWKRRIFISKEKKEKKRKPSTQVEGFKKASFFEKILPDKVEIFSKTRRA